MITRKRYNIILLKKRGQRPRKHQIVLSFTVLIMLLMNCDLLHKIHVMLISLLRIWMPLLVLIIECLLSCIKRWNYYIRIKLGSLFDLLKERRQVAALTGSIEKGCYPCDRRCYIQNLAGFRWIQTGVDFNKVFLFFYSQA